MYLVAHTFWQVIGAELLLGVCYAFISGTDNALLYESLHHSGRGELYTRCDGRMTSFAQVGEASGALCAGLLYVTSPLLPFIAQIGVWIVALGVALSLKEPDCEQVPITSHLGEAVRISRYALLDQPAIRATMVFGVLLGLSSFYPVWLVQPFMQQCGVPLAWFGPIWAGANLIVALCAYNSHRLLDRLGLERIALLFMILVVCGYLGLGLTSMGGSFLFYFLLTAMRGLQGPIIRNLLQQRSSRTMRASLLSLHNLLFRLGYVVSGPCLGWVSDHHGLRGAFLTLAASFALLLPLAAHNFLKQHKRSLIPSTQ